MSAYTEVATEVKAIAMTPALSLVEALVALLGFETVMLAVALVPPRLLGTTL